MHRDRKCAISACLKVVGVAGVEPATLSLSTSLGPSQLVVWQRFATRPRRRLFYHVALGRVTFVLGGHQRRVILAHRGDAAVRSSRMQRNAASKSRAQQLRRGREGTHEAPRFPSLPRRRPKRRLSPSKPTLPPFPYEDSEGASRWGRAPFAGATSPCPRDRAAAARPAAPTPPSLRDGDSAQVAAVLK